MSLYTSGRAEALHKLGFELDAGTRQALMHNALGGAASGGIAGTLSAGEGERLNGLTAGALGGAATGSLLGLGLKKLTGALGEGIPNHERDDYNAILQEMRTPGVEEAIGALGGVSGGELAGMALHKEDKTASRRKTAFLGMSPNQWSRAGLHAAGGAAGGAATGAMAGGEGNRMSGALQGGLAGGALTGLGSVGRNATYNNLRKSLTEAASMMRPGQMRGFLSEKWIPKTIQTVHNDPHILAKQLSTGGGTALLAGQAAPVGAAAGLLAGGSDKPATKQAFMGLSPHELQHAGLRAAGGAAIGAGTGAIAGGENNRMSGALAGGALGGLTAGAGSLAAKSVRNIPHKTLDADLAGLNMLDRETQDITRRAMMGDSEYMHMFQNIRNKQHANQQNIAAGITGNGVGKTMLGGGAMGAAPAMLAGRAMRDE